MDNALVNIPVQNIDSAPAAARDMLNVVQGKFGFIPSLTGVFPNAPALHG